MPAQTEVRQLPLMLRTLPDRRFETFVDPPPGALDQLRALALGREATSILLTGASGTGKTHLALSVSALAQQHQHQQHLQHVLYLDTAAIGHQLQAMLEGADRYRLVVLDGLDAVVGDRDRETVLFDVHNRVHAAGGAMLYTATVGPEGLGLVLPDVRSRLAQCARITLHRLDDARRADVLRLRAQRRGLTLDDAAIDWLLRRVGRNLGELTGLLDMLDTASLAAQRRITVPFLREVLGSRA